MPLATEQKSEVLCAHCRLPVPAAWIDPAAEHQFCCAGCRAVFESVHACGLSNYYRLRDAADAQFAPAHPGRSKFAAFDTEAFATLYVQPHGDLRSVDLCLEGVTCGACVWLIEKLPTVLDGVIEARLSLRQAVVRITWDSRTVSLSRIARTLDQFGYTPSPARAQARESSYRRELRRRIIDLGVAGALMGNLMLLGAALYAGWFGGMDGQYVAMFRGLSLLLGVLALAWPGREFFRSALAAVRTRSINIDVPIVMALAGGGAAGVFNVLAGRGEIYFDSLATLIFLLLVGRFLQFQQQRRAEASIDLLFSLTPSTSRVVRDGGGIDEVPAQAIATGDVAEVRPGELFPADGVVIDGRSSVNTSLLTGESRPVPIAPGDEVFGGTQNGAATVRVRLTRVGENSRVGGLMKLLERGLGEKPPIVRFTDRVGAWFVVIVSLAAVVTFGMWCRGGVASAIDHAIALVIVTCPCVLGLATPMTLAVAIGRLARRDVLVKSATAIERLSRGGTLMLDKTGTLTRGELTVLEFFGDPELRGVIAAVEAQSTHPAARALVAAFQDCEPPAQWRTPVTGRIERGDGGVEAMIGDRKIIIGSPRFLRQHSCAADGGFGDIASAQQALGRSVVQVAIDGRVRASVALGDALREDAASAVGALRRCGFTPVIYSGDAQAVVDQVAAALGVEQAYGQLTPEEKLSAVKQRPDAVMIGDGVNDAAALAAAGVGIAVHGGAEASLAAADVYVARPGLSGVVDLVHTSRRAMRVVRTNLAISLSYNLLAGALAMAGLMTPLAAAIIMPVSSATVLTIAIVSMSRQPKAGPR